MGAGRRHRRRGRRRAAARGRFQVWRATPPPRCTRRWRPAPGATWSRAGGRSHPHGVAHVRAGAAPRPRHRRPGCNTPALLARFDAAPGGGPRGRPARYACVDFEETFEWVGAGVPGAGWPAEAARPRTRWWGRSVTSWCPDAFPFQVLGPDHLDRLGPRPARSRRRPARRRAGGRGDRRPRRLAASLRRQEDAVDHSCKALANLLVTDAELASSSGAARGRRGPARQWGGRAADPTWTTSRSRRSPPAPRTAPHPARAGRRGRSRAAQRRARGVSPVLPPRRWYRRASSDADRQEAEALAARLTGTRGASLSPAPWRSLGAPARRLGRGWPSTGWPASRRARGSGRRLGDAIPAKVR